MTLQTPNGRALELDTVISDYNAGYIVSLSGEHHKIHDGNHYDCQDYDDDVDIASPKYWHFRAPGESTLVHISFQIRPSGPGLVEFFEAPTTSSNGTSLNTTNNDRNSSNTADLSVYYDPTVLDDGTRICVNVIGTSGVNPTAGSGGVVDRDDEFILGQGQYYLVKYSPYTDNQKVSLCLRWYEHTPQTEY